MRFANPLPWWGLLVAAAVVSWAAWRTWSAGAALPAGRRGLLATLRFAVLLGLLLVLMRPVVVQPAPERGNDVVAVLVDASRSMQLRDAGPSRFEQAISLVGDRLVPSLRDVGAVEVLTFGDRLAPADPATSAPTGTRSDAASALREVRDRFAGRTLRGVILVSDGAVTTPGSGAGAGVPVHAIGVGREVVGRDREVLSATVGDPSVTGSVVDLDASVVSYGYGREAFDVRLLEDGRPADVRRVWPVADGSPSTVTFRVAPRRDRPTVYSVEVPADSTELTPDNNRVAVLAPPPGRVRRLLVLEGAPGFDHSFVKRVWDEDPGLQVDAAVVKGRNDEGRVVYYVQASSDRAAGLASGLPANRAALFAYDAVVLANFGADALTRAQLADLQAFVSERGGGLVFLGTRSFDTRSLGGTPLEEMLPLAPPGDAASLVVQASRRTGGAEIALTSDGERHPVMRLAPPEALRQAWEELPALASVVRLGGPRPGASVLALGAAPGGGTRPIVAVQRYGRGRVLAFAGEASWRWKMMLPSTDRRYDTFWRQAARWVVAPAEDPVAVDVEAMSRDEATAVVHVRNASFEPLRNAAVALRVTDTEGRTEEHAVPLADARTGRYVARLAFDAGGARRVEVVARDGQRELGRAQAWFLAGALDPEMTDPRRHDDVLRRIAEDSGGRLVAASDVGSLAGLLQRPSGEGAPVQERDAWHHPLVFLLLVTLLCADWTLRRRWGLR